MPNLTTADLVNAIAQLGTQQAYQYPSGKTNIRIVTVTKPEGPIEFLRWNGGTPVSAATPGSITQNQLATAASIFSAKPNYPIHFDRLFSGSGNSRSAFEALLAHTPHFFICYLQRAQLYTGSTRDLKHIMWCPDNQHQLGQIGHTTYTQAISEVELSIDFGNIQVTSAMLSKELDTIDAKRIHTQMQVALIEIGNALGFRTWIAKNDRSIPVGDTQLGNLPGVIQSLDDVPILYTRESKEAASRIDCIWFTADGNYIPAVIEIEHSTGVTSGMTRMLKFKSTIPSISTEFVVVSDDTLRSKVVSEANNPAFQRLRTKYMPYSTARDLYRLINRYPLKNVVDHSFIGPFMENIVE